MTAAGKSAVDLEALEALSIGGWMTKRHRWNNGDTCADCQLHREGAGAGPYGAMRYYRDAETFTSYKPGPCPVTRIRTRREKGGE